MIIRVEPKEFFMHAVYLVFNAEQSDLEDEAVRQYLLEHKLYAKTTQKTMYEGWNCEVMYFGGCYLGRHLSSINELQLRVVEKELVSQHVQKVLVHEPAEEVSEVASRLARDRIETLVDDLVNEFNIESSFGTDENGQLKLALDEATVQGRFMELAAI